MADDPEPHTAPVPSAAGPGAAELDWANAYPRLATVARRLEAAEKSSAEDRRHVLRARAAALARPLAGAEAEATPFVVFRRGGVRFAVDPAQLLEAVEIDGMVRLFGVPRFYRGLLNHRGAVFPVVDVPSLLGVRTDTASEPRLALLAAFPEGALGVAADAVEGVVRVADGDLAVTWDEEEHASGTTTGLVSGSIVLVDIQRLLRDSRLIVEDRPAPRGRREEETSA